jgi:hypothetical protein
VSRVLATQQADQSARHMAGLTSDLLQKLTDLQAQGKTLSDPNEYDGPEAVRFRSDWQTDSKNLQTAINDLESLRATAQSVIDSILQAGGLTVGTAGGPTANNGPRARFN